MNRLISPRRRAPALVMSLVLPGFGQLYNGEPNKAVWLFLLFVLLTGPGVAGVALYLPSLLMLPALVLGALLALGLWAWGCADAWRTAGARTDHALAPWQVSGMYAAVLVVCGFVILPATVGYVRAHDVQSFRIASNSMEPGLRRGDFVFADKRYNCAGCKAVRRGDIAVFTYPSDRTLIYVKRIIGLPGDHVEIRGSQVLVNGRALDRGDGTEAIGDRSWDVRWGGAAADTSVTVPAGSVFVLGDDRGNSTDSRQFGCVPLDDVAGRVRQIWASFGEGGIRWDRLGAVPR